MRHLFAHGDCTGTGAYLLGMAGVFLMLVGIHLWG